jgi:hypothetical protein
VRLDPGEIDDVPTLSGAERNRRYKRKIKAARPARQVAVLDFETPPFDNTTGAYIFPFLAVLYAPEFPEPVVIWEEDNDKLIYQVYQAIVTLPGRYIIYAHNGGRFDFLFMLSKLRGEVMFKGRALMSAKIGNHEIRDSLHIIPEKLKNANRKTEIDYQLFTKGKRNANRRQITEYCIDDCVALYEIVEPFTREFSFALTIGQAAMARLKKHYTFERLSNGVDEYFRSWFFGGRVECLRGGVIEPADYRLYDVNSMYPYAMATREHPVSNNFSIHNRIRHDTIFLTISCDNSGAFVGRDSRGNLTTKIRQGTFNTTIWEYEVASRLGLIGNVEIHKTISFDRVTNFSNFILPLYEGRQRAKEMQKDAERIGDVIAARHLARDVLFYKLLMNNAYGKFAQNPRRFKVHCITEPMERPDDENAIDIWGDLPAIETDQYWIWQRPTDSQRFNNVATAASITGAARAILLDALHTSIDPVYCDTDSIICHRLGDNTPTDTFALGAWDIETDVIAYIGAGKKLYAYRKPDQTEVVRAKGMNGVTWADMLAISNGAIIKKKMLAPTIGKDGSQLYMSRDLRSTWNNELLAA